MRQAFLIIPFLLISVAPTHAQEDIRLYVESKELWSDELLRMVVAVDNGVIQTHDEFPELQGFEKVKTEKTSRQRIKDGKITETDLLIQYYKPQKEGLYILNAFNLKANEKNVRFASVSVRVKKAEERGTEASEEGESKEKEPEFKGLPAKEAFLILRKNKSEIYVGEGFTITFAFCVLKTSSREIQFYDLDRQFSEIIQKIRPSGCLAYEIFSAATNDLVSESIVIQGREYYLFRLYKAALFPLGVGTVKIPGITMKFSSQKISDEDEEEKEFVNFSVPGFSVLVKDTPPHPLKNKVTSGVLRLKESVSADSLHTGESFTYRAEIVGEANFGIILPPKTEPDTVFDFFAPLVAENTGSDGLQGKKSFTYTIVAKAPGRHRLDRYFQWIYFNTKEKRYDTLASDITVLVSGEPKNAAVGRQRFEGFYKRIVNEDNRLVRRGGRDYVKYSATIFIAVLTIGVAAVLLFKKKKT